MWAEIGKMWDWGDMTAEEIATAEWIPLELAELYAKGSLEDLTEEERVLIIADMNSNLGGQRYWTKWGIEKVLWL